jgi:fatty acid desaturase
MKHTLTVKGVTYDVTGFVDRHPGGESIMEFVGEREREGRDATDMFLAMHGPHSRASKVLDTLPIISVNLAKEEESGNGGNGGYAELYEYVMTNIVCAPDYQERVYLYFVRELRILLGLYAVTAGLLPFTFWGSAVALSFALLHSGWLSHHVVHKQLASLGFRNNSDYCVVSLMSGYSADWWAMKHNQKHHAHTNVIDKDTDIALELFKFDEDIVGNIKPFMRYQHIYLWPLLTSLRALWCYMSICRERTNCKNLALLGAHHAIIVGMPRVIGGYSWPMCFAWWMATTLMSGFMIGFVVIQNHCAEECVMASAQSSDHLEHTVKTTRNLPSGTFSDFFTGYLNYQIEHHLFPWLPSVFFAELQPEVQRMCRVRGLQYKVTPWRTSVMIIYNHLQKIAGNL